MLLSFHCECFVYAEVNIKVIDNRKDSYPMTIAPHAAVGIRKYPSNTLFNNITKNSV